MYVTDLNSIKRLPKQSVYPYKDLKLFGYTPGLLQTDASDNKKRHRSIQKDLCRGRQSMRFSLYEEIQEWCM